MERKTYEGLEGQALVNKTVQLIREKPNAIFCPYCQVPVNNERAIVSLNDFKTNSIGFLCFSCNTHFIIFRIGTILWQKLENGK